MNRLMCSKDRKEIEFVKKELFKAGIPSEIRSNPLAQALGVTRLELWIEDEADYYSATKLYAAMQTRGTEGQGPTVAGSAEGSPAGTSEDNPATLNDAEKAPTPPPPQPAAELRGPEPPRIPPGEAEDLEQASGLLEREIEGILARESKLEEQCESLEAKANALSDALDLNQNQLAKETTGRAAAEKKTSELSTLLSTLERELGQKQRSEEQLQNQLRETLSRLKTREDGLTAAKRQVDGMNQELQAQQRTVTDLKQTLASREQQCQETEQALAQTRAELEKEKELRAAAEQKAADLATLQQDMERRLADQTDLQQRLQAHLANLNSLRTKLHGKRAEAKP